MSLCHKLYQLLIPNRPIFHCKSTDIISRMAFGKTIYLKPLINFSELSLFSDDCSKQQKPQHRHKSNTDTYSQSHKHKERVLQWKSYFQHTMKNRPCLPNRPPEPSWRQWARSPSWWCPVLPSRASLRAATLWNDERNRTTTTARWRQCQQSRYSTCLWCRSKWGTKVPQYFYCCLNYLTNYT